MKWISPCSWQIRYSAWYWNIHNSNENKYSTNNHTFVQWKMEAEKKTDKSHHKWQSLNSVTLQCLRVRCFYGTIKMCDGDVDIFHDSITHHHKLYIWCDSCCCCWTFCTKLPCKLRPEKQEYAWNQLGFILKNVTKYSITFSWKQRIERKKTCFMFIPCSTFDFPSTIFSSVNPFCTVFFPPFHWKHDGRIFFFLWARKNMQRVK